MREWRRWGLLGLALWVVAVTFWALQPISATVRTGVNTDGTEKNATVECDAPLSGNTSPTAELPTLGAGESLGDQPCESPVTSGRTIYVIDMVVAAAVLVFLIVSVRRPDRSTGTETAALEGAARPA